MLPHLALFVIAHMGQWLMLSCTSISHEGKHASGFKTGKNWLNVLLGSYAEGDLMLKADACVSFCSTTSNKKNCNVNSSSDLGIKQDSFGDN